MLNLNDEQLVAFQAAMKKKIEEEILPLNENISEERKGSSILIFKDSYANSFIQFLANNYETIDIVDLRHFKEPISNFMKDKEYNQILIMYSFDNLSSDINIRRLKF